MRLGLSSYTYTWAVGVPGSLPAEPLLICGLLEKAIEKGIGVVQIADNLPIENLSEEDLDLLLEYAENKNINLEMGSRGLSPDHTMKCLLTAEYIKSPLLRMVIDSAGFEPQLPDIISIIRDLLPEFRSRKIRLAIENHDRFKARQFEEIVQAAGSEWIGICLDSVNSMGAGEGFETVSDILIPYTLNLHIKDFTIFRAPHKMGLAIEGRPAGKGMLNIPELVTKIEKTGLCRSAILELWTPPGKDLDETIARESSWADESITYLKTILK